MKTAQATALIAPIAEMQLPTLVWHRPLPKGLTHAGGFIPPGQIATADQVVGALRRFKARGCVGLVLVIDSQGGEAGACMEVFDAIRDFSRHGGVVVAYIAGEATSSAVHWALAADLVVMAPGASYQVHASVPLDGERPAEDALYASEVCRALNEWQAATIRARAAEVPAAVTEALEQGTPRHRLKLPAEVALHFGWADAIGDGAEAGRILTDLLERGEVPRSRRRAFLTSPAPVLPGRPQVEGLAMVGIAEDGVTVVDLSGGTTLGTFAALTANNPSATGWVELNGYVQGRAASGTALGTLAAPGSLHEDARYVRLAVTFNSAAGDGVQELDQLELDVVTSEAGLEDGAITVSKLAADAVRTSDYAEAADTTPTAGVKMLANTVFPAWAANTAYSVGDIRTRSGRGYRCTTAGTSAGGAAAWSSGTTYAAGNLVSQSGSTYASRVGSNLNHTPYQADSTWWEYRGSNFGPFDGFANFWDGTAKWSPYAPLRIGPGGVQLAGKPLDATWFAGGQLLKVSDLGWNVGGGTWTQPTMGYEPGALKSITWDAANSRLAVTFVGGVDRGWSDPAMVGFIQRAFIGGVNTYLLREDTATINATDTTFYLCVYAAGSSTRLNWAGGIGDVRFNVLFWIRGSQFQ